MDINDIYGLIDKFDASSCGELKLEMSGASLELKRSVPGAGYNTEVTVQKNAVQEDSQKKVENVKSQSSSVAKEIKAPLVGTFYTAAGPDDEPFVKIGQSIHAGDVIGIIEAMKLMNEVTADCDGVVKEVAAENGAMVEYGQPLVILN